MPSKDEQILGNILKWANENSNVRAVVLNGSRARLEPFDELADFDIAVFCQEAAPLLQDNTWFEQIDLVWVYIPESYPRQELTIPTRLVIYDEGIKVDFSLFPATLLNEIGQTGELGTGYKVLLDKDKATANWLPPTFEFTPSPLPTEVDFNALVNEFWFEAYHIAKYLRRDELWLVKFRDWTTKELLLKIIGWHALAKGRTQHTYYLGKHMKEWVEPEVWNILHGAFAYFDGADSWQALYTTTWLFRRLAKEISQIWHFSYPEETDKYISDFINRLQEQAAIGDL